ncbi:redoxin domain-containing protein [Halospeciosus flavus]|uniref:Redoxin domain-containing protein n=1 Tax=Halospeciosus flavus TaxID=3032283 RepID=A0ABD5Z436_9EURY|nr:redoxin domain-containing protein [Halospeciosus flavus]
MVSTGDDAPDFTAPLANGDVAEFTLSEHLDDGPVVLAFFPAAFTGTCTTEMCTFQDQLGGFEDVGATVVGVSVDLPFALNEFRDQEDLTFGLVSDHEKELIEAYDVWTSMPDLGVEGVAERAVFVVNSEGEITYDWVGENLGVEPPYEAVRDAAADAE